MIYLFKIPNCTQKNTVFADVKTSGLDPLLPKLGLHWFYLHRIPCSKNISILHAIFSSPSKCYRENNFGNVNLITVNSTRCLYCLIFVLEYFCFVGYKSVVLNSFLLLYNYVLSCECGPCLQ